MRNFTFLQREFSNTTVKSLFWLTWLLLFGIIPANAQVATNYGFSQLLGTFTPITGGISLGTETTDDERFLDPAVPTGGTVTTGVGLPIGFDFTFNGQVYNRVAINANGWISFGNSSLTPAVNNASTSANTPLASTTATTPTHLRNRVAALAVDLQAQIGASLRIQTIGDAPNRVCVIQWLNYRRYLQTGHNLNFQIRLNETTNIVDIVYGTMIFNTTSSTVHVGLGGSVASDFNNRQTTTNWNATTAGTSNSASCTILNTVTAPVSGTTFRWAIETCIRPTALVAANITPVSATINFTVPATLPTEGYEWELRTSGLPGSGAIGLTNSGNLANTLSTANLTGLLQNTEYVFYIRSNCGASSLSSWASVAFITSPIINTPYFQPFATTTLPVGFVNTGFIIGSIRGVTGNPTPGNNIYVRLNAATTANFTTVNLGPVLANELLTFDYKHSNFASPFAAPAAGAGSFNVQITTDYGANYTTLQTVPVTNTNAWQSFSFDMTPYVGQIVRVRIVPTWVSGDFDLAFDNISIGNCLPVTGLSSSNVTNNFANVAWTGSASATNQGYEWELRTSGAPGSGATGLFSSGTLPSNAVNASLTALNSGIAYTFHIRSNCGNGDLGTWVSTSFTTVFVAPTPYFEPFATTATPVGYNTTSFLIGSTAGVTGNPSPGNNIYINLWSSTTSGSFNTVNIGPISAGQLLSFDYKHSNFSTPFDAPAAGAGSFNLQLSTDLGANYTTVQSFTVTNTNAWQSFNYDLTPYIGQIIRMRVQATWSSGDFHLAFDNIMVASCLPPSGLSTSSLTTNSVNLNWTASVSNPADGYQWEVRTSGAAGSGATGLVQSGSVAAGVTTASVSGLTSSTAYQFYVRSVCSASDNSVWVQGPNFTTLCNPVTEFTQNFDSATVGALPVCWSRAGNGSVGNVVAGAIAPFSAPNQLQLSAINGSTVSFVLMPPVSNLQAETHRLRFRAFSTSAARILDVGYFTDESDLSTFTVFESIPMPSTTAAVSEEFFVMPTGIPAGVTRLAFRNLPSATGTAVINIDNVIWQAIPNCLNPTIPTASNITNVSVQLQWIANAGEVEWDIIYGAPGFNPATEGTLVAGIFNNPYTLTGLLGDTNYSYYVRAVCSPGSVSPWEGPISFRTKCNLITTFTQNFDALTAGANTIAPCWGRLGNTTTNNVVTGSVAPMSPSNRYNIISNAAASPPTFGLAVMPGVSNLNAGTHRLRFTAFSTTANAQIAVGYLTNPDDAGSFVVLSNLTLPGTVAANAQEIFYEVPNTVPAGVHYLAIRNQSAAGSVSVFFDNVAWEPIPSCPNPTALSTSGVTSTQATLAWSASVNNTSWEIEYGITGFIQGSGTIVSASTNPFVLTGLTPATTYQFYVRGVCAGPENSVWSQVGSFTTLCSTETVIPYAQNFNSTAIGSIPLCWSTSLVSGTTNWLVGTTAQNGEVTSNNDGNFVHKVWTNSEALLISNAIDLSAYAAQNLKLTFKNHRRSPAHASDRVNWYINSQPNLTGAILLQSYPSLRTETSPATAYAPAVAAVTANGWYSYAMDFPGSIQTGSQVYLIAQGITAGGSASYALAFDDFLLDVVSAVPPLCATNVQASQPAGCGNFPITITWNPVSGADGYKITAGTTPGGTNLANAQNLGNVTSFVLNTPTLNTTYYYTIIPFNANGDALSCSEQTFTTATTGCYCASVPTSVDGQGITNIVLGSTNFTNTNASYTNHTATVVDLQQGVNANVQITFATGFTYNSNIWIDFNDNFTFEPTELVYQGESLATNPTTLNASFIMPINAALGTHRMRIGTADTGQAIPNPCYNGSYGVTLDFAVNITAAPACPAPLSLTATAISTSTATLGWTSNASQLSWEIEYGLTGFTQGTGTIVAASTNPFVLTGLLPNTTYQFYVRAVCAGSTFSNWSSVTSFTTACESISSFPFNETFEANSTTRGCWTNQQVAGNANWTFATGAGGGAITTAFQGTLNARFVSVSGTATPITRLVSPIFNLTGLTTPQLKFHYAQEVWDGDQNSLKVYYRVDQVSAWVELAHYTNNVATWTLAELNLPNPSATYQIAFEGINNWGRANVIDNVVVEETLSIEDIPTNQLTFYPNPVKDVLNLVNNTTIERVEIYNLLGQQVMHVRTNATQTSVQVGELAKGAYIVKAYADGAEHTFKIIKN